MGAWVVIDEQRGMFETASIEAARILSGSGSSSRVWVAEVVSLGEFIEVRTIAAAPRSVCASNLGVEQNYALRFFVQPEALQQVLVRPKQVEFDDGTKFALTPGVPVIATGERGEVRVGEVSLSVALDEADVGHWFTASPHEPQQRRVVESDDLLFFFNACGQFVLRIDPDQPGVYTMKGPKDAIPQIARNFDPDMAKPEAGILGILHQQQTSHFLDTWYVGDDPDDMDCSPITWTAAPGTKLSWSGGGEAGTVLVEHDLPHSAQERADQVCFAVSELDVCIEAAKLERKDDASCKPSRGLISKGSTPGDSRFDAPSKRAGEVQQGKATVGEGLDPDIVRRIVRAHINEARSCYDSALTKQPTLAGKVEIAFEINAKGKVGTSTVHTTSLEPADDGVGRCIAKAVKRWTFPKPRGGVTVSVVYPFDLSPS